VGFITDLGSRCIINSAEAVSKVKENEFASLFEVDLAEKVKVLVQDCTIENDSRVINPEEYWPHRERARALLQTEDGY